MRTVRQGHYPSLARGLVAMMIVLAPASAYSQADKGPPTVRSEKEKKIDEEIDKSYREALKQRARNESVPKPDPWQTIRPASSDGTKH